MDGVGRGKGGEHVDRWGLGEKAHPRSCGVESVEPGGVDDVEAVEAKKCRRR